MATGTEDFPVKAYLGNFRRLGGEELLERCRILAAQKFIGVACQKPVAVFGVELRRLHESLRLIRRLAFGKSHHLHREMRSELADDGRSLIGRLVIVNQNTVEAQYQMVGEPFSNIARLVFNHADESDFYCHFRILKLTMRIVRLKSQMVESRKKRI